MKTSTPVGVPRLPLVTRTGSLGIWGGPGEQPMNGVKGHVERRLEHPQKGQHQSCAYERRSDWITCS